jgi:hypothetical protein
MTKLYRLSGDVLVPVGRGRLNNKEMIKTWLARQPDLLADPAAARSNSSAALKPSVGATVAEADRLGAKIKNPG